MSIMTSSNFEILDEQKIPIAYYIMLSCDNCDQYFYHNENKSLVKCPNCSYTEDFNLALDEWLKGSN